jgi:hypothetical protein
MSAIAQSRVCNRAAIARSNRAQSSAIAAIAAIGGQSLVVVAAADARPVIPPANEKM